MKRNVRSWTAVVVAMAAVALAGCGKKTDATTELDKAASALAQAEQAPAAPAPQPVPEPQPEPAIPVPNLQEQAAAPTPVSPAQQMQAAIASYKTGQLEDAVTRLQRLRATPTLTAQQRMALQDSVAAVMAEVYELAAKGDARAIAAVKQYEQMQSAPRR